MPEESNPDYHGPTAPDGEGKQKAIPDVVHERFHESIKDVLAKRVLPKAREQMEEALRKTRN